MGTREFKLPDVGEGVAEGELVAWLVGVGDRVSEDQPVAEVETDKALVEVPSPVDGTVAELRAEEGEMVPVGNVIIVFETDDDEAADGADAETDPDSTAGTDADTPSTTATAGADPDPGPDPEHGDEAAVAAGRGDGDDETTGNGRSGRVFAAPSARRLARELGVDIATVEGSGPGGRVTEADIRASATDDEREETETTGDGTDGPPAPAPAAGGASDGTRSATRRVSDGKETDPAPATVMEAADRDRTLAAPATRQLARDLGVDLDAVPTDELRDGEPFVDAEQVRSYARARQGSARAAPETETESAGADDAVAAESEPGPATGGNATTATAGDAAGGPEPADADVPDAPESAADVEDRPPDVAEVIPYRGVRRTIGDQMETSVSTAPHVTHHDTADVKRLVELRGELKARAEDRGVRLTYLPFVVKAVIAGLRENPILNATLDEAAGEIRVYDRYDIGIAVATEAGLMVPVVERADQKGVLQLAEAIADLAERARERRLAREEMQGSTFTITNFGAVGGEYATPIINYPETAILGLGRIEQRPTVVDGAVAARHTLPLSLSIDHRVIDGAEAAAFTNDVIDRLEDPELLLLE